MTLDEMKELFEKHDDLFISEYRKDLRKDLLAFNLLDKLNPVTNGEDIVCAAEHDEIYLSANPQDVATNATEEDIITLIRCGVFYDGSNDGFRMFV